MLWAADRRPNPTPIDTYRFGQRTASISQWASATMASYQPSSELSKATKNRLTKKVTPAANREAVAQLRTAFDMSERRAASDKCRHAVDFHVHAFAMWCGTDASAGHFLARHDFTKGIVERRKVLSIPKHHPHIDDIGER